MRWDQGPYGTSGICPHTMSWIEEGDHAAYMAQQDPPCPGDCGLGFALFVTSFVPGVGEVVDVFDIGSAIANGELDQAALIAILSFAPGRASAVLELGTDGLKRMGLTDELAEGIIRTTTDCFSNSFSAGTMVMTKDGPKPIEEIEEGDMVLAYDEATGEISYYPVTDLITHIDMQVVYLTISGETLVTTANHPFYTSEGIWLEAGELQLGDEIRTAVWTTGEVEAIYIVTQPQRMYNFTVAVAHTYFVGDRQWLVHNNSCPWGNGGRSGTLNFLDNNFRMTDLENITEQLGIDPENILLRPQTRRAYIRELMLFAERHGLTKDLIDTVKTYIENTSNLEDNLIDVFNAITN